MDETHLGRYLLQEEIGRGGMGVVYRAHDLRLSRPVAIKMLGEQFRSHPAAWGMVLREAQIISALHHPSICIVYDVGEDDQQPYIVMEYLEGCALSLLLVPSGLSHPLLAHVSRRVLGALDHAHKRGIIHRDVKSSNVIMTPQGDVKILDFGLAKHTPQMLAVGVAESRDSSRESCQMAGTIQYLAPEILQGKRATTRTDVWSFGVVLYEMATGQLPFRGRTHFEVATSIMTSDPIPPTKKIPNWAAHVVAKCLNRDVAQRYRSIRDILSDLPDEKTVAKADIATKLERYRSRVRGCIPCIAEV